MLEGVDGLKTVEEGVDGPTTAAAAAAAGRLADTPETKLIEFRSRDALSVAPLPLSVAPLPLSVAPLPLSVAPLPEGGRELDTSIRGRRGIRAGVRGD